MKIARFNQYINENEMAEIFLSNLDTRLTESKDLKKMIKDITKDLKLNTKFVFTFGTGLTLFIPLVQNLINNMNMNLNLDFKSYALLTITSIAIIYVSETDDKKLKSDCKSMLEELKLRGVGNGIVKKCVACIESIKSIGKLIGKYCRITINGLLDLLSYTTLMIPIINGLMAIIGKYKLNLDTLPGNFLSLSVGVSGLIAKHGIKFLINKIFGNNSKKSKDIIRDIEYNKIKKIGDGTFSEETIDKDDKLIREKQ